MSIMREENKFGVTGVSVGCLIKITWREQVDEKKKRRKKYLLMIANFLDKNVVIKRVFS